VATKRSVPEEKAASTDDAIAVSEKLTPDDIAELEEYAELRIARIGKAADGRDANDLLGEAFRLTLAGTRTWNRDKTFVQHLKNTMQSVSGHWTEKFAAELRQGRKYIQTGKDARTDMADSAAGAVQEAPLEDSEERVAAIYEVLAEDPVAVTIVEGWADNLTGPELKELLELDETAYRTKVRWIHRRLAAAGYRPRSTKKGPQQ
jgi:hypothetical protein